MKLSFAAILSALLIALPLASRADAPADALRQTRLFLDAYAAGDVATVLSLASADVRVYGSDVAETVSGAGQLRALIDDDQRLWRHAAHIGQMRDVSIVGTGEFESLVFDAPFSVGDGPSSIVRFTMVWRAEPAGWRLVQASNAVPSVGQSAAQLLAAPH